LNRDFATMLDDLRAALHRLDRQPLKARDAKDTKAVSGETDADSREERTSRQHRPSVPASAGTERAHHRTE
jgi:ribonuclease P protein component